MLSRLSSCGLLGIVAAVAAFRATAREMRRRDRQAKRA
jgi:hypothetical protein